ncbi:MAG: hypothetical protein K6G91_02945 [Kiritimatiellae bacterium]|nr:hypothetical protein [Kiritimatiellia bacterium]
MVSENESLFRYDRYFSGEEIHVGDVVETYGTGNVKRRGRVIKHFLPGDDDPDAKNWNMEHGGMMIEFDRGEWVGYGPADEELFFVARDDQCKDYNRYV